MNELYSPAEIVQLTDHRTRAAQCAWLEDAGIPYKQDGARILLSREHVRLWLAGTIFRPSVGVNLGAVR